jgi:hypothetical protein
MAVDPLLGWTLIAESTDDPHVLSNEADTQITNATQENVIIDAGEAVGSPAQVTVDADTFKSNFCFVIQSTGSPAPTSQFELIVPVSSRHFGVLNQSGQTIIVSTNAGLTVSIADNVFSVCVVVGNDVFKAA